MIRNGRFLVCTHYLVHNGGKREQFMNTCFTAVVRRTWRGVQVDGVGVLIEELPRKVKKVLTRQNDAADCLGVGAVVETLQSHDGFVVVRFHLDKINNFSTK